MVDAVVALDETSAALLPAVASMVVSFSPAVTVLLIRASAPTPWALNFAFFTRPTPTETVVALDVFVASALMTGALSPTLTVVISALLISARTVSFPSPLSLPVSLSVNATPTPRATVVSLMASSPEPAMVVLLVLSAALTTTEDALVILSFTDPSPLPSLVFCSSPITAMVSLWPRFTAKLP